MEEPTGKTLTYTGRVVVKDHGEAMDVVFVGDDDEPFAERFSDDLEAHGRYVSVRYHLSDQPRPLEDLDEQLIRRMAGAADADYTDHYSDITGYLWTDQELNVGGHDLLDELRSGEGRYLTMVVEFRSAEVSS